MSPKFGFILFFSVHLYFVLVLAQRHRFSRQSISPEPPNSIFKALFSYNGLLSSFYTPEFLNFDDYRHVYDYIIVGAGSAGSVLANRLSEDPSTTILLLEAGGHETFVNGVPLFSFFLQKSSQDWQYKSAPLKYAARGLIDNSIPIPRGKVIGGSSSLNYMMYIRGNKKDFDNWEEMGAKGWSWKDVFPYFVKSENNQVPNTDAGYHGTDGPISVSFSYHVNEHDKMLLQAAQDMNQTVGDINGSNQIQFSVVPSSLKNGSRCSTGYGYLVPAAKRSNLHVSIHSMVKRVIFNKKKRAIGVEFIKDNVTHQVYSSKEVILSAGSINTPQILMLSGVGPKRHLQKIKIPVIHDLPGVGENLQDHPFTPLLFTSAPNTELEFFKILTPSVFAEYLAHKSGYLSTTGVYGTGFYRTKYAVDERPDIQILYFNYGMTKSNAGVAADLACIKPEIISRNFLPIYQKDAVTFLITLVRPRSKGTIRLSSANYLDKPVIDLNIFANISDVYAVREGCKFVTQLVKQKGLKKLQLKQINLTLADCEDVKDYNSDAYYECLAQTLTYTLYHPVGTAKMGPDSDPFSVVDSQLKVKGVTNLRVVDGSVLPEITSGNTNAPIIMLAEKAADLLKGRQLKPHIPPYHNQYELLNSYYYL